MKQQNCLQDKYIMASMLIVMGIIVWHAVVGALIYPNLPTILTKANSILGKTTITTMKTTTSMRTTTTIASVTVANLTASPNCPVATTVSSNPTPASNLCLVADRTALGLLGLIYITMHLTFLLLIICEVHVYLIQSLPEVF